MRSVYYQNTFGRRFILYGDGLTYIDPMELHGFAWSYTLTNNLNGSGGTASNFARYPRTFELELRMRGYTVDAFLSQVNTLHDITEADVCAGEPGRLYVDDQYLTCYLAVSGDEPHHPRGVPWMTRHVTVLAVEPYWCTPVSVNLSPPQAEGPESHGKKYDLRYAYRYGTGMAGRTIVNAHYAAAPMVITIFGAAQTQVASPSITIDGVQYGAEVSLTSTDRLVIDQVHHTIYTVSETGVRTSVFDQRIKTSDIFAPLPTGTHTVIYSGDYNAQITMIYQRSELKWTA